jgi:uncharacterized RDD family membrane protein YckC
MDEHVGEGTSEPDGLTARLSRMALGPARAAARSGREALTGEAERAVEGLLAGPMPEAVARSLVEHHVFERALAEWLEAMAAQHAPSPDRKRLAEAFEQALASPALERRLSEVVESRWAETLADQLVHSAAFRRALSEALESPEVRSALARQTAGFGGEIASSLRRRMRGLDDHAEARIGRALGRRPVLPSPFGGLSTRGLAITVDAVLAHAAFLVAAGSVALIASLAGSLHSGWLAGSVAAAAWALVVLVYFVGFWSATGQTPGMRMMSLRVVARAGSPPSVWRSLLRFVGLVLAILPFFLGFAPVLFDARRRALQDYLAGTVVRAET